MSIKFVNTPSLEGMDAQITPVVGENPLCRIPSVRALYTAVSRQELMDHKPGTVQGFVLAFEEGLKNIVFANLDCRHDHFKLVNTVAEAVRTAVEMHSQNIFVPVGTDFTDEEVSLICQGLMSGAYRFDLYKTEKSPKVRFTVYSERDYSAAVQNGKMLGECTNLARDLVKRQDAAGLRVVFGSVPDTLSQLIRTAFVAAPGRTLVDADFSAIEARMIAWLAGEEWVLEVFRTHGKIYEAAAAQMFGVPIEAIKKGNPEYSYRQKGKVATLALGYQGGAGSLVSMGALRMGIPEEDLPDIVERWRNANPAIVQFWSTVEAAAREAVNTGRAIELWGGRLAFARELDPENDLDFLTIRMPNGRKLYYAKPHMGVNRFGRPSLCYWGMNQTTKKWEVVETYGGKLAENITQAAARDCLAEAIDRLEAAGYPVAFHIHDEVVIDAPPGRDSLEEVINIMRQVPPWAEGLPLNADGWVNPFFKKD